MSARQQYADLVQPICVSAQAEKWTECTRLIVLLNALIDDVMAELNIALAPQHMEFLTVHGRIHTAHAMFQKESLCGAVLSADTFLSTVEPDSPKLPS